ncbi:uncharacterized protein LOC119727101 [Patiria miniata]|uniref:LRAT domain-containing protein n=1 Tax=Patiria miniata TaxID=46514 RepID=A0A913ZV02_PATMI|nr:uncharacterized protein LOC119727101 [Patiria miniata]
MASNNNSGIVSKWYCYGDIAYLETKLCLGDRLEFECSGVYTHWGIHVGGYKNMQHAVIHCDIFEGVAAFFTDKASSASRKSEIRANKIGQILGGYGRVRINNSTDKTIESLDPNVVVKVAMIMQRRKTPIDVNLLDSNSEYFVNLCRYDRHWSSQVFAGYNFGIEGKRYTSKNIADLEDEVCPGDRLEFGHALHSHWGIYVGRYNDKEHAVIHFSISGGWSSFSKKKTSSSAFAASQKPEILADQIGKILGASGRVRINNSRDQTVQPLNPYDIIRSAKKMHRVKTPIDYDLLDNNCEHFVNLCRYNKPHSEQAEAVQTTGENVILFILGFTGLLIVLYLSYPKLRGIQQQLSWW